MYSKVSERIDLFIKLEENEKQLLTDAEEITDVNYELESEFMDVNDLFGIIKNLIWSYRQTEKKLKDLQQDMEDNYVFNNKNPYNEYDLTREF